MKSVRILHITDMHFGKEISGYENNIDEKDKSLTSNFGDSLRENWMELFFNALNSWITKSKSKLDLVVCTGDLGTAKKPETIDNGVCFLDRLSKSISLNKNNFLICPGNHDINRDNEGNELKYFEDRLSANGFRNYSSYNKIKDIYINDVPIISINSCIGGAVKSNILVNKYIDNANNLSPKDIEGIKQSLKENNIEHLSDFMDIPSIGLKQKQEVLKVIQDNTMDSVIIIMHHNPIPNCSIEIRPYSNIIDSGSFLTGLMDTGKSIFILHGHTHYDYNALIYYPPISSNYLCSMGCGSLDSTNNSKANILEFYYNNSKHLVTKVSSISRKGSIFQSSYSHSIFDKNISKPEKSIEINSILDKKVEVSFSDIKKKHNQIDDDVILKLILKEEHVSLHISKNNSDDYNKWIISKKYN